MGFRLSINGKDDYGKCYGYNAGMHLYSLDYLISIDAFKDWNEFTVGDYGEIEEFFSYASYTDKIILTKEQMKTFIDLYTKDICKLYNIPLEEFEEYTLPESETYTIEWY